jgi:hypothetical protein
MDQEKPTPTKFCELFFTRIRIRGSLTQSAIPARSRPMPGKEQEKEFLPQGVSVTPWKGSFPPRRSKEIKAFSFENLLLDSACARLDFAKFGFGLGAARPAVGGGLLDRS